MSRICWGQSSTRFDVFEIIAQSSTEDRQFTHKQNLNNNNKKKKKDWRQLGGEWVHYWLILMCRINEPTKWLKDGVSLCIVYNMQL